jgi:hypothetical protein
MSQRMPVAGALRATNAIQLKPALFAAATAVFLCACGGGGGSSSGGNGSSGGGPSVSGGGFAPASGPGDTMNYVPNAVGNVWNMTYSATDSDNVSTSGLLTISIPGTKIALGATATIFDRQDSAGGVGSGQDYYAIGNGGVTFVGNSDSTDLLTPQLVPFAQLLFPVATGQQSRLVATGLPVGNDSAGKPVTLDMTQTISNDRFEDVATTAGLFPGALRQTTTVSGTAKDSGSGQNLPVSGTDVRWYYPGAGLIRESITVTSNGLTSSSESQVSSYAVNGTTRGLAPRGTVQIVSPNAASVPNPPAARPLVVTDGTSYMAFARVYSGTTGSFTSQWMAVPLTATGAPSLGGIAVSPTANVLDPTSGLRAAAGFDGTNYLLVYEQENVTTGPSLIGQLVSTTGATVGPAVQLASSNATQPTLAFDGSRFLLVHRRYTGVGSNLYSLEAAFVTTDPTAGPNAGPAFTISQPDTDFSLANGSLAFNGTQYFAVWEQTVTTTTGVYGARIGVDGSLPDGAGFLVHAPESAGNQTPHQPVVIADNGRFVVFWQDYRGTDMFHNMIYGARISVTGALLDGPASTGGVAVTTVASDQQVYPAVVHDQGTLLVLWSDVPGTPLPQPNSNFGLRGARLTSSATALTRLNDDALGLPVADTAYQYPTAATTGTGTILVWLDPAITITAYIVEQQVIVPVNP